MGHALQSSSGDTVAALLSEPNANIRRYRPRLEADKGEARHESGRYPSVYTTLIAAKLDALAGAAVVATPSRSTSACAGSAEARSDCAPQRRQQIRRQVPWGL